MSFNKKIFHLFNGPHEAGFNKTAHYLDIKIKKLGFKENTREFTFYKRKESNKSFIKLLRRLGLA